MKHLHPQFLSAHKAQLIVIDIQEKLFPFMAEEYRKGMLRYVPVLLAAAKELALPVTVTEQYRKGLGRTIPELRPLIEGLPNFEKVEFASTEVEQVVARLAQNNRKQVIVCGMETHICVYQTALGLRQLGYDVHLVADAAGARFPLNHETGLRLMDQAGCRITTTETVLFQLLEKAGTEAFKKLQKMII